MTHLDEELARVAAEDDAPAVTGPAAHSSPPAPRRNVGLLVALLVAAGGLVALVMNFQDAAIYAKTVDQLVAEKSKLAGRPVRVEGDLVKGSLVHTISPCEYSFRIANKGAEIPVSYKQCIVPDTFQDRPDMDVKVTVEGKLQKDGVFEATLIMAKCPSKYDMREKAKNGEKAPHAM